MEIHFYFISLWWKKKLNIVAEIMSCHNSRKDTTHKCQLHNMKVLYRCVIHRCVSGKIGKQSWQSMSHRAVHVKITHWTLTESVWNCDKIEKAMLQKGIQRSFNSLATSHQGGLWERQIPMARQVFCSVPPQQILDDESLQTLLCEVEAIFNSWGLCTVSYDKHDPEALTPIHIFLLKSHSTFPYIRSQTCRNSQKQTQYQVDLFWKRQRILTF